MGLDGVEFIVAVEEAFNLAIPDEDAAKIATPGDVVDYLEQRLEAGAGECLEQRAFHAVRRAGMVVLGIPRRVFRPDVRWDAILPPQGRRRTWKLLHEAAGVGPWPPMWIWGSLSRDHATIGQTSRYVATYGAASLQAPGEGWSRRRIEDTIRGLMAEQLGIRDFKWDQRFVQDLGVD